MKKIIMILFSVLFFVCSANADVNSLVQANQVTINWDAQTVNFFRIFIKPVSGGSEVELTTVTENNFIYTFTEQRAVVFGVQAVVLVDVNGLNETVENQSEIAWSDISEDCLNGETFGAYFIGERTLKPSGLRN